MSKFSPFGIDGFTKGGSAAKRNLFRFDCAVLILNIGPALWLIFLLKYVVPDEKTYIGILASAIASLSVFAFLNFGYALFGSEPLVKCLYLPNELEELTKELKLEITKAAPSKYFLRLGLLYLLVFPLAAFGLRYCH